MRIRFEDFVLNPFGKALKIYEFAGIDMNMDVKKWIDKATSPSNKEYISDHQGLLRNGLSVLNSWRKELGFENFKKIQKECQSVLQTLGYKQYNSEKELHDLTEFHFKPIW